MRSKFLNGLVAASLLAGATVPAAVQAAPQVERESAEMANSSELDGGYTIWIIGAVVLGLAIWGIIELTDDDEPVSP